MKGLKTEDCVDILWRCKFGLIGGALHQRRFYMIHSGKRRRRTVNFIVAPLLRRFYAKRPHKTPVLSFLDFSSSRSALLLIRLFPYKKTSGLRDHRMESGIKSRISRIGAQIGRNLHDFRPLEGICFSKKKTGHSILNLTTATSFIYNLPNYAVSYQLHCDSLHIYELVTVLLQD